MINCEHKHIHMYIEFLEGLKEAHNDQNNGYYGNQFIAQYSKRTIVIILLQPNLKLATYLF